MGLVTRQIGPNAKGSKLSISDMDNNLYYLQSLGVSGVTYSANTLTITNPTGGTKSVTISADTNTFITGSSYNNTTNTIELTDNDNNSFNIYIDEFSGMTVNGTLSATTISGGTFYGDGSNLTNINGYSTTVVNISSAQILNMATTPIELLPAPGVNKYYDIDKIILEYTYGTSIYDVPSNTWVRCYFSSLGAAASSPIYIVEAQTLFEEASNRVVIAERTGFQNTIASYPRQTENANSIVDLNTQFLMNSFGSIGVFTPGDGTLRAIITYTIRTFGA